MNARRNENNIFTLREQLFFAHRFRNARIHELSLDLAIALQIREVCGVTNERDDKRTTQHSFAKRAHLHVRTRFVDGGEIVGHLFPTGQFAICTRRPAENGGGCWHLRVLCDRWWRDAEQ